MNHDWIRVESNPNMLDEIKHTDECKRCGCKREKWSSGYIYERSSMIFHNGVPDCIDWDKENNKSID